MWARATTVLSVLALSAARGQDTSWTFDRPQDSARTQALSLAINVPAYRLDLFVNDTLRQSFQIAIGMRRYPTPRGEYTITAIEWNPWWTPPASPWAAKEKPMPPGPQNPMGRVKLDFRALYFLHGTPFPRSIGSAASHGCIRLTNTDALALARIVARFGAPTVDSTRISQLEVRSRKTARIALDVPVPIVLRYDRIEIRRGRITIYPDVYRLVPGITLDSIAWRLAAAGYDSSAMDTTRAQRLIRRGQYAPASMIIDSLLVGFTPE